MDSAVTHTISSKAPALDSTSQQAKADIDPSLASGPARALDRLPHRLQTPHDLPDTETLSRQTSLGQTSATDSHFTSPTSPNAETGTPKPARGRLPSISELIANGHDSRAFSAASASPTMPSQHRPHPQFPHHRPTRSTGSTDHASPLMTSHPPATSMSPSAYAAYPAFSPSMTARSPTSAVIDGPYYSTANYYGAHGSLQHRRPSAVSDRGVLLPPTLNSASSSGDSGGATASSVDGYSTSHTTPIETAPRPTMMLPPPPAMMLGGFRCTYDGCTAPPFQTQYLLTSHKNVHSQNRPHYCPVKNCSRAEGGKGFKRKNEMIRHGLVHSSPGYICPFCPEREHKYPRPDNLQRHVRVHHVDKDRDDPTLQEVLNQRTEGQGKTRRRRTLTGSPTAS